MRQPPRHPPPAPGGLRAGKIRSSLIGLSGPTGLSGLSRRFGARGFRLGFLIGFLLSGVGSLALVAEARAAAPGDRPASGGPGVEAGVAIIDLPAGAVGALRALGEISVFTSAARPLRSLADITVPQKEVATADLGLARSLMALLRSGGVKFSGGAYGVARLTSVNHLAGLFRGPGGARLLVMNRRDGQESLLVGKGGGLPVVFRGPDGARLTTGPLPGKEASARSAAPPTSFGPLLRATLTSVARTRIFAPEQVRRPELKARPGRSLLVVHIDRDFGAGLGQVSFLFGSGIILEPDFTPLLVVASGGRRFKLAGTYAEGPTLELVYEIPASARDLRLEDGSASWPLRPEPPAAPRAAL